MASSNARKDALRLPTRDGRFASRGVVARHPVVLRDIAVSLGAGGRSGTRDNLPKGTCTRSLRANPLICHICFTKKCISSVVAVLTKSREHYKSSRSRRACGLGQMIVSIKKTN